MRWPAQPSRGTRASAEVRRPGVVAFTERGTSRHAIPATIGRAPDFRLGGVKEEGAGLEHFAAVMGPIDLPRHDLRIVGEVPRPTPRRDHFQQLPERLLGEGQRYRSPSSVLKVTVSVRSTAMASASHTTAPMHATASGSFATAIQLSSTRMPQTSCGVIAQEWLQIGEIHEPHRNHGAGDRRIGQSLLGQVEQSHAGLVSFARRCHTFTLLRPKSVAYFPAG